MARERCPRLDDSGAVSARSSTRTCVYTRAAVPRWPMGAWQRPTSHSSDVDAVPDATASSDSVRRAHTPRGFGDTSSQPRRGAGTCPDVVPLVSRETPTLGLVAAGCSPALQRSDAKGRGAWRLRMATRTKCRVSRETGGGSRPRARWIRLVLARVDRAMAAAVTGIGPGSFAAGSVMFHVKRKAALVAIRCRGPDRSRRRRSGQPGRAAVAAAGSTIVAGRRCTGAPASDACHLELVRDPAVRIAALRGCCGCAMRRRSSVVGKRFSR